jgi:hypothetical protein
MKVLILGSGHVYKESKCHSCMTNDEYLYCISESPIRLDKDPNVCPDVVAVVGTPNWSEEVRRVYGADFDIVIDETCAETEEHYETEVAKLLRDDGIFYGRSKSEKVKWFNTSSGLKMSP